MDPRLQSQHQIQVKYIPVSKFFISYSRYTQCIRNKPWNVESKQHINWFITFRCSNPAKLAGLNEINRCISNNEIPSLFDAVHINGRENCRDADIPPIARLKFPSPFLYLPVLHSIRLSSNGQGVCELTTYKFMIKYWISGKC